MLEIEKIYIGDLSMAEVLMEFYNKSKAFSLGYLEYRETDMTLEEAEDLLEERKKILINEKDYAYFSTGYFLINTIYGRTIEILISKDNIRVEGFNKIYGKKSAQKIINKIKKNTKSRRKK